MAMVRDFVRNDLPPRPHAYDDPSLSPIEFLQAVYHDPSLPMSIRIDAARGLLPYTEPRPASAPSLHIGCTIVIGGLRPCDHGSASPSTEPRSPADPTGFHSQNPFGAQITVPHDTEPGDPQNLTTIPNPPSLDEIREAKAVVDRLRPDLAHLLVPEPRLCQCGHWLFGPCPLGERCREKSKLN
jgi:hypothetical protein